MLVRQERRAGGTLLVHAWADLYSTCSLQAARSYATRTKDKGEGKGKGRGAGECKRGGKAGATL